MTDATLLITGGAGFVGSHFARLAHEAGRRVVILDDLSGAEGVAPNSAIELVVGDIGDTALVRRLCRDRGVTAVAHFAGRIQVGESVTNPALYFDVNVARTLALLDAIRAAGVSSCLFSSTAAVYGDPASVPISELAPRAPVNPYGATKLAIEFALEAWAGAYGMRWCALRYFNAAGAHPDGSLSERHAPETHLIPLVLDAGRGARPPLTLCGDDYDTVDGTCVRDYVHVSDLATAHLAALVRLERGESLGPVNLGSGIGASVREVLDAACRVLGHEVPHSIGPRRAGDPPILIADPARAGLLLGWRAERSALTTIIDDALRSRIDADPRRLVNNCGS